MVRQAAVRVQGKRGAGTHDPSAAPRYHAPTGVAGKDAMTVDQTLLSRVHKLLALARSPNVHEAATAAGLAQALIARHRLQGWIDAGQAVAADPDPIEDARDSPLEVSRRLRKWKVVLACAIADANGCIAYTLDRGKDQAIVLVGRARDRAAVLELWTWLVARIEWLSATHGAGQDRQWHEAFRVGAVASVADRLAHVEEQVREEFTTAALVRVDPAAHAHREALDRFVSEHLRLGKGRGLRVDASAWEQGRQAAVSLDLGPRGGTGDKLARRAKR